MQMFSLFDVKAEEYLEPFSAPNTVAARRSVIDLLSRNPESNRFVRHREDYVLVRLGEFDIVHGMFSADGPSTMTTLSALYDDLVSTQPGGAQ